MPENVFVNPSAPDEPTAPLLRNVYAKGPTATSGEPMVSSTGELVARFDETDKETQSFTIPNPRFAGSVLAVNLPSSREDGLSTNFQGWTAGEPHLGPAVRTIPFACDLRAGRRVSKQKCVSYPYYPWESMRRIKEVETAISVDDLDTSR